MALPPKGILHSEALKKYIFETSAYPRENELLKELREATVKKYGNMSEMSVPVDEGHFLSMLVKIMNATKTLEIGVFTGYSLLATALALPNDSQVTAIDIDHEAYEEIGQPIIRKAGVEHKINFVHSDAIQALTELSKTGTEVDFAFVDAHKPQYKEYHELLMNIVKVGGVIAYDNTLWFGLVAKEEDDVPEHMRLIRDVIIDFNTYLVSDPRIDISQVSIGDGLTLCRRIY